MENFEDKIKNMTKPEISQLKHQEMLTDAISNAKDKSVLSWWWLSIPLYMIAALSMKTFFMKGTTLVSNIHDLAARDKYSSFIFFVVVPAVFIILNFVSIRKIYKLSAGSTTNFLETVWFNFLIIIASLIILIIYLL